MCGISQTTTGMARIETRVELALDEGFPDLRGVPARVDTINWKLAPQERGKESIVTKNIVKRSARRPASPDQLL
jgi:hypothetical protein